jgi:hypothetical protein
MAERYVEATRINDPFGSFGVNNDGIESSFAGAGIPSGDCLGTVRRSRRQLCGFAG